MTRHRPVLGEYGLLRCATADGGAWVGEYRLDPSYRHGAHTHARRGLAVGLAGTYVARLGRREHALSRGQALVFPDAAQHRERAGVRGARCLLLLLDDRLDSPYRRLFARDRVLAVPLLRRVGALIAAEVAVSDDATPISLDALIGDVVAELGELVAPSAHRRERGWVMGVREELDARFRAPPSLAELADLFGRSREHLARSFRRTFGVTIGQYVRKRRVDLAARELAATDRALAALAADVGFADQSHLTRWFRRHYGTTPAQYRHARRAHRAQRSER